MTLRARLALGILAIAALLVAPLVLALRSLDELHTTTRQLSTREFAASLLLARMRGVTDSVRRAELQLGTLRERARADEVTRGAALLAAQTDTLRSYAPDSVVALDSAARVVTAALAIVRDSIEAEYTALLANRTAVADRLSDEVVRPAIDDIERGLQRAEDAFGRTMRAHVERATEASAAARRLSALALVIALAMAALIAVWLTRSISGPVFDLERGMKAVADGVLTHRLRVNPERGDEFGRLAASYASMAEQLATLDRMKAEFVSIASHELKTPLNVILGYVQLLEEGVFGDLNAKQREICRTLIAQGRTLARLVNQLLDISRFQAGAGKLDTRPVRLGPFLDDLERAFRVLAMQREVAFHVERGPGLPEEVCWDPDRMNEVLGNLLSNAFKFTDRGGRVELRVAAHEAKLRMDVRDTGAGIPAEQLPFVFKKFYQADNQDSASAKGSGLGLAIASEIVNAHGGRIGVESTPGVGTNFSILLPARVESGRRIVNRRREPEFAHS